MAKPKDYEPADWLVMCDQIEDEMDSTEFQLCLSDDPRKWVYLNYSVYTAVFFKFSPVRTRKEYRYVQEEVIEALAKRIGCIRVSFRETRHRIRTTYAFPRLIVSKLVRKLALGLHTYVTYMTVDNVIDCRNDVFMVER